MLNILRSIPWAFRITLHTVPVPFLAAVCTTLLLTFMPSAQVVLVNAAVRDNCRHEPSGCVLCGGVHGSALCRDGSAGEA